MKRRQRSKWNVRVTTVDFLRESFTRGSLGTSRSPPPEPLHHLVTGKPWRWLLTAHPQPLLVLFWFLLQFTCVFIFLSHLFIYFSYLFWISLYTCGLLFCITFFRFFSPVYLLFLIYFFFSLICVLILFYISFFFCLFFPYLYLA